MTNRMKIEMTAIATLTCVILLACGNKNKQTEPMVIDGKPTVEELQVDTIGTSVQTESLKEEGNQSTQNSSCSSSSTYKSKKYDNMRGFDPASEDDMEDNGMSRYMENNDEEGWD